MSGLEKRRSFRVRYPQRLRPLLYWDGGSTLIIDLSESGLRCIGGGASFAKPGRLMKGAVRCRCGAVVQVSGEVVRVNGEDTAINLTRGVSFSIILREQRALRANQRYAPPAMPRPDEPNVT